MPLALALLSAALWLAEAETWTPRPPSCPQGHDGMGCGVSNTELLLIGASVIATTLFIATLVAAMIHAVSGDVSD